MKSRMWEILKLQPSNIFQINCKTESYVSHYLLLNITALCRKIVLIKLPSLYLFVHCTICRTYFVDWKNVLHIEVESKVNHVKNSVTAQCCSKTFVESLETQTTSFNNLPSLNKARGLLQKLSKRRKSSSLQKENNNHSIISILLTNKVLPILVILS